ncbi:hypothetical protein [Nocardioides sp. LML1-1-1.1]|uniref:hypothetical protein n=1 Tax=Nocardioides sp. LML1-1-1.1 TaxID=3135248 RepID=UPI003444FA0A
MPNTPGPGGYALAWLASVLIFGGGLVVASRPTRADLDAVLIVVLVATLVVSIPFAVVGVLVVHVLCAPVEAQWFHVLVAGLVGYAATVVAASLSGDPDWFGIGPWLAATTALARAAVIPLVHRRRAAATAVAA